MKRWKKILLLVVLLAGVVAGPYWGLRVRNQPVHFNRALPATTEYGLLGNIIFSHQTATELAGAGILSHGAFWAAPVDSPKPFRLSQPGVQIGDLKTGRIHEIINIDHLSKAVLQHDDILFAAVEPSSIVACDLETFKVSWRVDVGGKVRGLAFVDDRLIAVTDRSVVALNGNDGRRVWTFDSANQITTYPAASGKFVCFGTDARSLNIIDAHNGKFLRAMTLDLMPGSNIGMNGEIAYVSLAGDQTIPHSDAEVPRHLKPILVCAVNLRKGEILWQYKLDQVPVVLPTRINGPVVDHESVYITLLNTLCAIDAQTGKERWRWTSVPNQGKSHKDDWFFDSSINTPAVRNGIVYAGWRTNISALEAGTGREVWRFGGFDEDIEKFGTESSSIAPTGTRNLMLSPQGPNSIFAFTNVFERASNAAAPVDPTAAPINSAWFTIISAIFALSLLVAVLLRRWRMFVSVVCALLCAVSIWAWFGSYRAVDFVGQNKLASGAGGKYAEQTLRGITSRQGTLRFGGTHAVWETTIKRIVLGDQSSDWWRTRGPLDESAEDGQSAADLGMTHFGWTNHSRWSGTGLGDQSERSLTLPHWFVVMVLAIAPFAWLAGFWRDRRRYPRGHCVKCGYDLRASGERCPECGEIIPAAKKVVAEDHSGAHGGGGK